jgi:DNA replication protein DnaC
MSMTITADQSNAGAPPGSSAQIYQRLRSHLAFLKMGAAAEALPAVLDGARDQNTTPLEAIEQLLAIQVDATESRQQASRLHFANLPAPWTIDDYDFSAQPGVDEKLIRELTTLRFLDDAANILFIGPPGVGKTMLSICLARLAAEAGHKAYFTTCEELVDRLKKATVEHRLKTGLRFFTQPKLLVLDEFGYRRLDEDGRSLLFEVINARYLKGSIITTSHVGINKAHMFARTCVRWCRNITGSAVQAHGVPAMRSAAPRVRCGGRGIPTCRGIRSLRTCVRPRRSLG